MTIAYIRGYIKRAIEPKKRRWKALKHERVELLFYFDNETTLGPVQNLKVGCYLVTRNGLVIDFGYYYRPEYCSEDELRILQEYCEKADAVLLTRSEFVEQKFLKYVLEEKAICTGFNLPFDIPLLGTRTTQTKRRGRNSRFHNGFSIELSPNTTVPRLKIKSRGKQFALIQFGSSPTNCGKHKYPGRFLDLHTLGLALSGERSISLRKAGIRFGAKIIKEETDEHGTITPEYLDYLTRDVLATHSLYDALMLELAKYGVDKDPETIFSQASIGKALLRKMGFATFQQVESEEADRMLGLVMGTYYGGLSQVACRHLAVNSSLVDVTSMYPTVNILMHMQQFLMAKTIKIVEDTARIQEYLDTVTKDSLRDPRTWELLPGFVLLKPDNDPLPVRSQFEQDSPDLNITIAELTSDTELPYTIADLIAAKLRSGKAPKISKGYRFVPVGKQEHLQPIEVLGLRIDPNKDDIFRLLVNERQRLKREIKRLRREEPADDHQLFFLKSKESVIKLIINIIGYGIYIEEHPEQSTSNVIVHSLKTFSSKGAFEEIGPYFNPMIGVSVTGAARLFLTLIEVEAAEHGGRQLFCDTDSMAIPPDAVKAVQDFFRPLNPYDPEIELIKEEYHDVTFIGVAAKRYALYKEHDGKIEIVKSSEHGLGQLMNPFGKEGPWHDELWKIMIQRLTGTLHEEDFEREYANLRAVCKFTVSNYQLWQQVRHLNKDRPYDEQIKPGGFMCRGYGTQLANGKIIKPIAAYNKDAQKVVRGPFIDANTGDNYAGDPKYWQPLTRFIDRYQNHCDHKLEGDTGYLKTKTLTIDHVRVIGKEGKSLVSEGEEFEPPTIFENKEEERTRLLKITPSDAQKVGVTRSALWKIKQKIHTNKKLNYKTKAVKKLTQ